MTDTNFFVLVGRLTRDSEITYTQSGVAIGKFSIACNSRRKQGDNFIDEAHFFNITMFGKYIEAVNPYLKKGQQVVVTGHLKQDRWEKDGKKFSNVSIVGDSLQMVGSKGQGGAGSASATNATSTVAQEQDIAASQDFAAGGDAFPEDVPF